MTQGIIQQGLSIRRCHVISTPSDFSPHRGVSICSLDLLLCFFPPWVNYRFQKIQHLGSSGTKSHWDHAEVNIKWSSWPLSRWFNALLFLHITGWCQVHRCPWYRVTVKFWFQLVVFLMISVIWFPLPRFILQQENVWRFPAALECTTAENTPKNWTKKQKQKILMLTKKYINLQTTKPERAGWHCDQSHWPTLPQRHCDTPVQPVKWWFLQQRGRRRTGPGQKPRVRCFARRAETSGENYRGRDTERGRH